MIVDIRPAVPRRRPAPALAPPHGAARSRLALLAEWRRRNEARRAETLVWSAWLAGGALVMSSLKVLAVVYGSAGA